MEGLKVRLLFLLLAIDPLGKINEYANFYAQTRYLNKMKSIAGHKLIEDNITHGLKSKQFFEQFEDSYLCKSMDVENGSTGHSCLNPNWRATLCGRWNSTA